MTNEGENPYASPVASGGAPPHAEPSALPPKRPASPLVIGIVSIVYAAFGLLGALANLLMQANDAQTQEIMQQMGYTETYVGVTQWLGVALAVCLVWIGIQLVRYRNHGRVGFIIYAWVIIVTTVANTIYVAMSLNAGNQLDSMTRVIMIVSIGVGGLFSLIFPITGLIFLSLSRVKQSLT